MSTSLSWSEDSTAILVIGDLILDEYLDGLVNRISPEAPVPIHLVKQTHKTAGGAANVARNVQLVGGHCHLFGVAGQDEAFKSLKEILDEDSISTSNILIDGERPTTRKTRVTSNHQQLVRIDWEEVKPVSAELQSQLITSAKKLNYSAILVSDYGKGCLTRDFLKELGNLAKEKNVPIVVDPKGKDYSIYEGTDLVTPNWKEACEAIGESETTDKSPEEIAKLIAKSFKIKNVLVTLGANGMLGLAESGHVFKLRAIAREVFDVSGAGDTVVALMALGLAAKLDLSQAMEIANIAAGVVVEKWGTQPIKKAELLEALEKNHRSYATKSPAFSGTAEKILSVNDAVLWTKQETQHGNKIVFTNGCFDILHAGHLSYLEKARSLGDKLIIAVNSDASVKRLKGETRPIIPQEQRVRMLAGLACVDKVVIFEEDTPKSIIEALKPAILAKGADYELADIVGADFIIDNGGSVERIEFVSGLSTSNVIEKIKGTPDTL